MPTSNRRFRIPVRRAKSSKDEEVPSNSESAELNASQPDENVNWSDAAMRLRAEMENYRKRQQWLADERVATEKQRLLTSFLGIVDNLDRIVTHLKPDDPYHESIQVTYDAMLKLLRLEGVVPIEAVGATFDPLLHEAVGVIVGPPDQDEEMVVFEEARRGYLLGDKALRPTRAIVAKRDQQQFMERYAPDA